jgi:flagellar motor switch protein FliM
MSDNSDAIRRKIQETMARADNYPLLEVITNAVQRGLGARLRSVFNRSVDAMLDSKEIIRFGDYLNTLMFPALLCIFESDRLPGKGIIFMEGRFMEDAIEMLLGFPENRDAVREARTPTSIDKTLIMNLADQCLEELSRCFHNAHEEIGEINFTPLAVETSPQFAMVATEAAPCHVSKFFFDIGENGYGGRMDIVLPIPMLSPIRRFLEQSFRGDRRGDDSVWRRSMAYAIAQHELPLRAEIETVKMEINRVRTFKEGDEIVLRCENPPQISLVLHNGNEAEILATGKLGGLKGDKVFKVTDEIGTKFSEELRDILVESELVRKIPHTKNLKFIR